MTNIAPHESAPVRRGRCAAIAEQDAAVLLPAYAQAGIAVIPLHNPEHGSRCSCGRDCGRNAGKHPRTAHGKDDATTNPGQISDWLARWPRANWGGVPPEGLIVLDIDPRNGGQESLDALEGKFGELPGTLTAQTGSGGLHIWLQHQRYSRGKLATGIDVKKVGGYVVLPPSWHACGGQYVWSDNRPAAPAPRWVRLKLDPPVSRWPQDRAGGDLTALIKFVSEAPAGGKNDRLYWACCRANESGLDLAPLVDAAVDIGHPRRESIHTAQNATKAPERKRRAYA